MNKTAIKNFAIWARNKLIADISYRAGLMGITVDGIQKALPQSTGTTEFYDIGTAEPYSISGDAVKQRNHLVELIRFLVSPQGCPWDKVQTHESLRPYVLEEASEVIDAIDEGSPEHLYDELGDMLLKIVLHAEIGRKHGEFLL